MNSSKKKDSIKEALGRYIRHEKNMWLTKEFPSKKERQIAVILFWTFACCSILHSIRGMLYNAYYGPNATCWDDVIVPILFFILTVGAMMHMRKSDEEIEEIKNIWDDFEGWEFFINIGRTLTDICKECFDIYNFLVLIIGKDGNYKKKRPIKDAIRKYIQHEKNIWLAKEYPSKEECQIAAVLFWISYGNCYLVCFWMVVNNFKLELLPRFVCIVIPSLILSFGATMHYQMPHLLYRQMSLDYLKEWFYAHGFFINVGRILKDLYKMWFDIYKFQIKHDKKQETTMHKKYINAKKL